MINNAGMNMTGDVEVTTVPIYEKGFNLNLYGAIRMTKRFLPNIRKTQGKNYLVMPDDAIIIL